MMIDPCIHGTADTVPADIGDYIGPIAAVLAGGECGYPSRKLVLPDITNLIQRVSSVCNDWSLLLLRKIRNHGSHCRCTVRVFVHAILVSTFATVRDCRFETSAQRISGDNQTTTTSSSGSCALVLDRTPMVRVEEFCGNCPDAYIKQLVGM